MIMSKREALAILLEQAQHLVEYKRRAIAPQVRRVISSALFQKQLKRTEQALTGTLIPHFTAAINSAAAELKKQSSATSASKLADRIYDADEWVDDLINRSFPILAQGMSEAAAGFFLSLGIDPRKKKSVRIKSTATDWLDSTGDELPPGVATDLPVWMQEEITAQLRETFEQEYWQEIDVTTRDHIETFLDNGLRNGHSIQRMAKEIAVAFPAEYSKSRATLVARTESGHALNGARDASYRRLKEELPDEASKHLGKAWLSVLGNTTRDSHANLDGELADEEGMFTLAGVKIPWPGHIALPVGERAHCQCTTETIFGVGAPPLEEIEQLLADDGEPKPESTAPELENLPPLKDRIRDHAELNDLVNQVANASNPLADEMIAGLNAQADAFDIQITKTCEKMTEVMRLFDANELTEEQFLAKWTPLRLQREQYRKDYYETKDQITRFQNLRTEAVRSLITLPKHEQLTLKLGLGTKKSPFWETVETVTPAYNDKAQQAANFLQSVTKKREGVDELIIDSYQLPKGARAFSFIHPAQDGPGTGIYVPDEDSVSTFIHEMGHQLEGRTPKTLSNALEFVRYRIEDAGTPNVSMREATGIKSYHETEIGNEDSFGKALTRNRAFYAGKTYWDTATEIVSLGVEELHNDPVQFAQKDPEFFKFIVGTLRGSF